MIKTEKLVYGSANSSVQFEGSISYEDSFDTPRPGVLVCHAYGGHSDFDIKKSEQLAELGYFAFAMDLYGQGRRGSNPQESMELMNIKPEQLDFVLEENVHLIWPGQAKM